MYTVGALEQHALRHSLSCSFMCSSPGNVSIHNYHSTVTTITGPFGIYDLNRAYWFVQRYRLCATKCNSNRLWLYLACIHNSCYAANKLYQPLHRLAWFWHLLSFPHCTIFSKSKRWTFTTSSKSNKVTLTFRHHCFMTTLKKNLGGQIECNVTSGNRSADQLTSVSAHSW